MQDKNRLLLVDGHNVLFQMFYGMPARILNKDGKAIQGTLGFVGAFLKMIKQVEPTHVLVVFDGEHENPRSALLEEYKGNREDFSLVAEEENPFMQLPDVYRALEYMGVKYVETESVEADDVIAGYVYRYRGQLDITIASWDSDFFQLIDERVMVLRYRGKSSVICDEAYIEEKFGILPEKYAAFKSLVGDSADNIRGAEKVGPKTAAMLLHQFGDLDAVLQNAGKITKKAVRESIEKDAERLRINYQLIKLGQLESLPYEVAELEYEYAGTRTMEILSGIGLK